MSLTPNIQSKTDELFFRWFNRKDVQAVIHEDLDCILQGRYEKRQGELTAAISDKSLLNNDWTCSSPCSISTPPCSPRAGHRTRTQSSSCKENKSNQTQTAVDVKTQKLKENREAHNQQSHQKILTSVRRQQPISPFYYPNGRPISSNEMESQIGRITQVFSRFERHQISKNQFGVVAKACGLPLYCKLTLFTAAAGENADCINLHSFLEFWKIHLVPYNDLPSKFVNILTKSTRSYLLPDDFLLLIQDVIDTHPGLTFLKEAEEFHSRYVQTVMARIFYCINRSWSGKISIPELRKSNFIQVLLQLEEEDDINQITDYFSYEHFYVIYCKFWELDKDHDLQIDRNDLSRHNDGAISARMINRIFSGAVTRGKFSQNEDCFSYPEFVWFLISEEDKRHPTSIEYWFRCMDLDGDGYLSIYELEYFYFEQLQRMDALGIEALPFQDCLCQMLDMVLPKCPGKISLSDLKRCKMTTIFFDTFFNLEKYLDNEQKDPFAFQKDSKNDAATESSDWNRFASQEYELLVSEEGANEQEMLYDDEEEDYEKEEEELVVHFDNMVTNHNSDLNTAFCLRKISMDSYESGEECSESDDYHY